MKKTFRPLVAWTVVSLAFILTATSIFALRDGSQELDRLYVGHHWFQLRDTSAGLKTSDLYRGAVAVAFNQRSQAETFLQRVIVVAPSSVDVVAARELLIHLYLRSGQYSKAVERMKEQVASKAGKPPSSSDRAMLAAMSQLPDQTVISRGSSTLHYEIRGASLSIPVSVNVTSANFLLDSDSNMSVISESEAKRLGLSVIQGDVSVAGVAGSAGGARMAVANDVVVGNVHLKNVSFLILGDDKQPFVEWSVGTRGILGLPVMLALETLRWRREGTIDVGFAPGTKNIPRANICFDNDDPITQVEFDAQKLEFVLDTGSSESELWPPFAKHFAALLEKSGKQDSKTFTGYTGSSDFAVVTLPEIHLALGGFAGILRSATVVTKPSVSTSNWYYGRAGMDILNQAQTVTIDFNAMTVRLN